MNGNRIHRHSDGKEINIKNRKKFILPVSSDIFFYQDDVINHSVAVLSSL